MGKFRERRLQNEEKINPFCCELAFLANGKDVFKWRELSARTLLHVILSHDCFTIGWDISKENRSANDIQRSVLIAAWT